MQPKKIALISDAWVPQVNGVVTTFQSIIPILEKKGFEIKILHPEMFNNFSYHCLLYTYDAADEEDSVDLGGRRIIKKKLANSLFIKL